MDEIKDQIRRIVRNRYDSLAYAAPEAIEFHLNVLEQDILALVQEYGERVADISPDIAIPIEIA